MVASTSAKEYVQPTKSIQAQTVVLRNVFETFQDVRKVKMSTDSSARKGFFRRYFRGLEHPVFCRGLARHIRNSSLLHCHWTDIARCLEGALHWLQGYSATHGGRKVHNAVGG